MSQIYPIIVCGIGRSGTSALLNAISLHPEVVHSSSVGESPFISDFMSFMNQINNKGSWYTNNFHVSIPERQIAVADFLYNLHVPILDRQKVTETNKFYAVKAFPNSENIQTTLEYLPGLRIIYIIRNGIEVVNSHLNYHGFNNLTFEECCKRWALSLNEYKFLENSTFATFIRHEELVVNPKKVFDKIFSEAGMSYSIEPESYIKNSLHNSSFSNDKSCDVLSILSERSRALEGWSNEMKNTFHMICGSKMNEYAYCINA